MGAATWRARLAGVSTGLVGIANVAVGAAGLASQRVQLSPGAAGGFLVVGVVTVVIAALVWRGSRLAAAGAFALFTMLLVAQLSQETAAAGTTTAGITQPSTVRTVLLVVLVLTCALAALPARGTSRAARR